ncbi:extracellular solute-binding protein [Patescibacteria group bacterium]
MFKKKKIVILYFIIVFIIVFGFIWTIKGKKNTEEGEPSVEREKAELEIWGVFEDSDVFEPLIEDFKKIYPNVKISYFKKDIKNYENDLIETIAEGGGPDIFKIHHTWLPQYKDKILPASVDLISFEDVKNDYVDVVVNDFVDEGLVYALPLSVDTLALYYNKDIFKEKGIENPPATWDEFLEDVEKISVKNKNGEVSLAGAAIGADNNVNRSTDILCLLMIQSGAWMTNENNTLVIFDQPVISNGEKYYVGARSLLFYTDFTNTHKSVYTWNREMGYSIDVFSRGEAAMMFNYSYHIPTVRSKSPYLNFDIAPMPQIKTSEFDVNYANYWGMAVSRNTSNYEMSWKFIDWLAQKENSEKYLELAKQPTARKDLISWQENDPDLGVFAKQSLTAYSWYQVDNILIEQYLSDMIQLVINGQLKIDEALIQAADKINILMKTQ